MEGGSCLGYGFGIYHNSDCSSFDGRALGLGRIKRPRLREVPSGLSVGRDSLRRLCVLRQVYPLVLRSAHLGRFAPWGKGHCGSSRLPVSGARRCLCAILGQAGEPLGAGSFRRHSARRPDSCLCPPRAPNPKRLALVPSSPQLRLNPPPPTRLGRVAMLSPRKNTSLFFGVYGGGQWSCSPCGLYGVYRPNKLVGRWVTTDWRQ